MGWSGVEWSGVDRVEWAISYPILSYPTPTPTPDGTVNQAYYNPQNFGGTIPAVLNQMLPSAGMGGPYSPPVTTNPFNQYNPLAGPNQGYFPNV